MRRYSGSLVRSRITVPPSRAGARSISRVASTRSAPGSWCGCRARPDSITRVRTGTVQLSTRDGEMPLYEAIPDDPLGAAIVFQEAYGVNEYIEDVARRLADGGY